MIGTSSSERAEQSRAEPKQESDVRGDRVSETRWRKQCANGVARECADDRSDSAPNNRPQPLPPHRLVQSLTFRVALRAIWPLPAR